MVLLAKNYHYIDFSEPKNIFDFFGFFGRPGSRVAGTGPGKPGIRTGIRITGPAAGYPAPGPGSWIAGTGPG